MSRKSATSERASENERKEYAAVGADWAYFIVQFLAAGRRTEIQPSEILRTQVNLRASTAERAALDFVCATQHEMLPSENDAVKSRVRDQFVVDFADGLLTLPRSDWVRDLTIIPVLVAERKTFDAETFETRYSQPKLFGWIWR